MPEPYVIQPPEQPTPGAAAPDGQTDGEQEARPTVHRPRIGAAIMDKLDEILEHVKGDDPGAAPEGAPEVSFEPEVSQLPQAATVEEEEDEEETNANGEPAANTPELTLRQPYHFPGRRLARRDDL